ncbi:MAG: hypothetical protein LBK58_08300 [Prevotellaceae bacterium]|jgi:hypothetical protein|nr:hypothetical protein [Prevotellaceae bacterium]
MIIANPMYDTAFKKLMKDSEASKFIVSTLLGKPVVSIEPRLKGAIYMEDEQDKTRALALRLYQFDYVATLQTGDSEYTEVFIEVQKALKLTNLNRSISERFKQKDKLGDREANLPVITVCILGFDLPEIATSCVRVSTNCFDAVHETDIDVKSHYIERMMNDCVVVQTRKIEQERYTTDLDKLLSVFIQDDFVDDVTTKYYQYLIDDGNIRRITDILQDCASNPKDRQTINAEIEAWEQYRELLESVEKEKLQKIKQKEVALTEKEAALAEKKAALAREEAALAREEALLAEIARLKTLNQ